MPAVLARAVPAVDFYIRTYNTVVNPANGVGTVTVEVGNIGDVDSTTDVDVILISPFYVNFDSSNLPSGTQYLVRNSAPQVPEMITFTVPAASLKAAGSQFPPTYQVGIVSVPNGPQVFDLLDGYAIAQSGGESSLLNNHAVGTVTLDGAVPPLRSPQPGENTVNFYFTYTVPLLQTGVTTNLPIRVGNASPHMPVSDAVFTFVTPYNVKIDRQDTAFQRRSPTYYTSTDPSVPDIVSVPVPRLSVEPDPKLVIDVLRLNAVDIPLIAQGGGYPSRGGKGFLSAGPGDFDMDLAVAICRTGIIQP
jgi:hypothetical protein